MPDRYPAIEDHAVIGDLRTVALVAAYGTIDWCCLPRFDSPAAFASLLDADCGGCFAVRSGGSPDQAAVQARYQRTRDQVPGRRLGRRGGRLHGPAPPRQPAGASRPAARPPFAGGSRDRRFHDHLPPGVRLRAAGPAVHAPGHGGAVFTAPRGAGRTGPARQSAVLRGRARRDRHGYPGPRTGAGPAGGVGRPAGAASRGRGISRNRPPLNGAGYSRSMCGSHSMTLMTPTGTAASTPTSPHGACRSAQGGLGADR